jgi:hypothetical protein
MIKFINHREISCSRKGRQVDEGGMNMSSGKKII